MRGVSMLWRGSTAPRLVAYRAEVVHFSADTQTGTVRLLHRVPDTTAGAVKAAEEELCTGGERPSVLSASFSAKQVFLPERTKCVSNLQNGAAADGAASCMYPCVLSCGCPMIALVERPRHTTETCAACATPSQLNAVHVRRLLVQHDARRPLTCPYYARLPAAAYECWRREGSDVVDEALRGAGPQRLAPLQRAYVRLSREDVEVLELLGLVHLLGSASEDACEVQRDNHSMQKGDDASSGTVDAVDAIPM